MFASTITKDLTISLPKISSILEYTLVYKASMGGELRSTARLAIRNEEGLETKLLELKQEFKEIEQRIHLFETQIRSKLADYMIEEQELTLLYKELKRQKKAKRLEQKKKGKNYKPTQGVRVVKKEPIGHAPNVEDVKELKKLYRELMFKVHPDKYSLEEEKQEVATELTAKIVELYKSGNLVELKRFYEELIKGKTNIKDGEPQKINQSDLLTLEINRLKKEIEALKSRYLYKVLHAYPDPMKFIEELEKYYQDRLFKLRKRTRKAQI